MTFLEIKIGDTAELKHKITEKDIEKFVDLTGDDNKLHVDKDFASQTGFKKPVAHGMLGASFISTIIGTKIPGDGALWYSQSIDFLLPVRVGDELTVKCKVLSKTERTQSIELETTIFNQNRQKVIDGKAKVKVVALEINEEIVEVKELPKKTALVLGASGGIGKAVVQKLHQNGYHVAIHYFSNKLKAENLLNDILDGSKSFIVQANLIDEADVLSLVETVKRKFSSLEIIINAATISLPTIRLEDLTWEDMQAQLEINVKTNFILAQKFLPIFKTQKYGKIVNIVTQAIEQPNADWLPYITAKSALSGFSKALAIELAKYGVRYNLVSPGMTETDLISEIPLKARMMYAAKTPLKRLATPEDIAKVIYFLSHPDSDYLTGETIRVNGGQVLI